MKRLLILVLLIVPSWMSLGQVVARLFYTKDWLLTHRDSAVYFRAAVFDTTNQAFAGPVRDFTRDAKPVMTGSYVGGKRSGTFVNYYPSGQKESEGEYFEGKRQGLWRYYHPEGTVKGEVEFDTNQNRVLSWTDSSGAVIISNGTGAWVDSYQEHTGQMIVIKGLLKDYLPEGRWTRSTPDGEVWYDVLFSRGEFTEGTIVADSMRISIQHPLDDILPEGIKHWRIESFARVAGLPQSLYPFLKPEPINRYRQPDIEPIFTIVEYSARPVKGMPGFYGEVNRAIRYPPEARRKGIEGRVFVEFIINRDGSLSDFKVIKGVGAGLDEEAIRVIKLTGKWTPGVQGRKRVRQRYTLPVIFKLG